MTSLFSSSVYHVLVYIGNIFRYTSKNKLHMTSMNVALLRVHQWPHLGRGCIFLSSLQRYESESLDLFHDIRNQVRFFTAVSYDHEAEGGPRLSAVSSFLPYEISESDEYTGDSDKWAILLPHHYNYPTVHNSD